jgi:uncharacterized protein YllA (UPF0747 family)
MTAPQNQMPLEQAVNNMRDNILRTQSQASTAAITSFDGIVDQLKVFALQINDRNTEIQRLQELLKKNNIDFAVPPVAEKLVKAETPKPTTKA